jgi:hypothetical protein
MSVCITRRIMEFRTIWLQSVLLHYGNEWLWLTAGGSSGLLWLRLWGISSLFDFYNLLFLVSFVDFMVIFNFIMLKFYLFSFLFVSDLICLLICFLYFCLDL